MIKTGLFSKIFGKKQEKQIEKQAYSFFKTFNGYTPVFTSWGGAIYEVELVRAVIHAKATQCSKLKVEIKGSAHPSLASNLRDSPNAFQTWSQFMYRLSTILDVQNTAFIVPVEDEYGNQTGMYPVLPSMAELLEYNGIVYIRYRFATGESEIIEFRRCGIMTKFQYSNDFFGENNVALSPTMELINIQNQGINEATKQGASFRFMARQVNFSNEEDLAKTSKSFTEQNFKNESSAVLLFPNTWDGIKQIVSKPYVVDSAQMEQIRNNVFDYFGSNEKIVQNKAYGDEWNAYYEGAIEPFAIQFSEVSTRMTYSQNERTRGNQIIATTNRIQHWSTQDKLSLAQLFGDRGYAQTDEIRAIFNYGELPDGKGKVIPIRGEYKDVGENLKQGGNQNDADGEGNSAAGQTASQA